MDLINRNLHLQGDTVLLKLFMAKDQASDEEQVPTTEEIAEPNKV